ncbi:MAG: hypothetical protein ACLRZ6_08160 [Lachnospiraceae bacterium]
MEDEEAVQKRQQYEQENSQRTNMKNGRCIASFLSDTRKKGFQRVMEQATVIEKHLSVGEKAGFVDVDQLAYFFRIIRNRQFCNDFAAVFLLGATMLFGIERQAESSLLCRVQSLENARLPCS